LSERSHSAGPRDRSQVRAGAASDELIHLSASELRRLYRSREVSPVDVTRAILDRIDKLNDSLNAFVTVAHEDALRQARRAERELAADPADKPLLGVPVSFKDLTPTRGIRTTRGSLLWQDWVPDFDAPVVERARAAGAIVLGKTNTCEFGWKGDAGNRLVGPTYNPWNRARTAGGSSGGAAAAVAAGMGPIAQGTDGAGSTRIPASFCAVLGLKPSFGLIPYHPASAVELFAHIGVITRTVLDAALFIDATAGPDARDRLSLNATGIDFCRAARTRPDRLTIAWSADLGHVEVEQEVRDATAGAAGVFDELGHAVTEVAPPFDDPYPAVDVIWSAAHAAMHEDDFELVRECLDPGRVAVIEVGRRTRGIDVASATMRVAAICEQIRRFFDGYDLLLTPTVPLTAFAAGLDHPGSLGDSATTYLSWTPFTYPFNLTGQPAASVPCGFASNGLPVGIQLVGRWREDEKVLQAAAAFEDARPWAHFRPADATD
jgi:aspartyl-tRNA(Asn)/glutamyl-tRNA(Gln) amidotransferase subunit A